MLIDKNILTILQFVLYSEIGTGQAKSYLTRDVAIIDNKIVSTLP